MWRRFTQTHKVGTRVVMAEAEAAISVRTSCERQSDPLFRTYDKCVLKKTLRSSVSILSTRLPWDFLPRPSSGHGLRYDLAIVYYINFMTCRHSAEMHNNDCWEFSRARTQRPSVRWRTSMRANVEKKTHSKRDVRVVHGGIVETTPKRRGDYTVKLFTFVWTFIIVIIKCTRIVPKTRRIFFSASYHRSLVYYSRTLDFLNGNQWPVICILYIFVEYIRFLLSVSLKLKC